MTATNLETILDDALSSRFDDFVRYRLPGEKERVTLIENRLASFKITLGQVKKMAVVSDGLSHAELGRAYEQAAKCAVLAVRREIGSDQLEHAIDAIRQRKTMVHEVR